MALVRGRMDSVGIEHNDGLTLDGDEGTYKPYPLLSFADHRIDRQPLEEPDELLAQGAREIVPAGQFQVLGTAVLRPRYDSATFLKIMANAMGGTEIRVVDTTIYGSAETGLRLHIFPAGGLQPRQWLKVHLGLDTVGLSLASEVKINKLIWEHANRAAPTASIELLGTNTVAGAAAALALHNGTRPIRATHLDILNGGTAIKPDLAWLPTAGGTWVNLEKVTDLKITIDHKMVQAGTYITSMQTYEDLAAPDATRSVEIELSGEMATGLDASSDDHPYFSYVNGTQFGISVVYANPEVISGIWPWQARWHLPWVTPIEGSCVVAGPGVLKWTVKALAVLATEWLVADEELPAGGIDVRYMTHINAAVESDIVDSTGNFFCHNHA